VWLVDISCGKGTFELPARPDREERDEAQGHSGEKETGWLKLR
jgi:hypothetical protein